MKYVLLVALMVSSCGRANQGVVDLFKSADHQIELVRALAENKELEHDTLSLNQIAQTIKKLEGYREKMIVQRYKSDAENRCLNLAQELIRRLTNARLVYEHKLKSKESVQKIALSAGAAVTVCGGLLLLKTVGSFDISITTAVACGVAAGCVVGAITYYKKH